MGPPDETDVGTAGQERHVDTVALGAAPGQPTEKAARGHADAARHPATQLLDDEEHGWRLLRHACPRRVAVELLETGAAALP